MRLLRSMQWTHSLPSINGKVSGHGFRHAKKTRARRFPAAPGRLLGPGTASLEPRAARPGKRARLQPRLTMFNDRASKPSRTRPRNKPTTPQCPQARFTPQQEARALASLFSIQFPLNSARKYRAPGSDSQCGTRANPPHAMGPHSLLRNGNVSGHVFHSLGKTYQWIALVSGHDLGRAEKRRKKTRALSPCGFFLQPAGLFPRAVSVVPKRRAVRRLLAVAGRLWCPRRRLSAMGLTPPQTSCIGGTAQIPLQIAAHPNPVLDLRSLRNSHSPDTRAPGFPLLIGSGTERRQRCAGGLMLFPGKPGPSEKHKTMTRGEPPRDRNSAA